MKRLLFCLIALCGALELHAMSRQNDFSKTRELMRLYNRIGYQQWLTEHKMPHSSFHLATFISQFIHHELGILYNQLGAAKLHLDDREYEGKVPCDSTDPKFEHEVARPLKSALEVDLRILNKKIEDLLALKMDIEAEAKLRSKL